MAVYLITYDLNREVTRPRITEDLKRAYPNWARLSESSYAVLSDNTPEQIYGRLKPMIDANDNIYVISLRRPYIGFGPSDVNAWLEKNLSW